MKPEWIIETRPEFQPEKAYCFHVLFGELLDLDYRVVFIEADHYRILLPNGARVVIEDHFFKNQNEGDYLRPENVPATATTMDSPCHGSPFTVIYGRNCFDFQEKEAVCGPDLIASTFFMLTRWEEFALPGRDRHGRFPADQSLAFKAGFLDRPVVNEYADLLGQVFARLGVDLPEPARQYHLDFSCDVDHPRLWWSAADRLKTLAGSIFSRGNPREAGYWLSRHFFRQQDPYDVFDLWLDLFEKNNLSARFNFLGNRPRSSDCWYPLDHPFVGNLLKKIAARGHQIGFHPSYEAFENEATFARELDSLRAVADVPVTSGRQHYLRFAAPYTWQVWEDNGLETDSTLGYPEAEGFRCGICTEFPVFNFLTRKMLRLREKPLIAMDVTLAQYRRYSPQQALERLLHLRRQVERHRGAFGLLWHNSSWNTYFWADWQEVMLEGGGVR